MSTTEKLSRLENVNRLIAAKVTAADLRLALANVADRKTTTNR